MPTLRRRLSGTDAAFLYLERKEIPLHIAAICIFEQTIPFEEFVAAIDSRLHLLPRYRQIVVDPAFHLSAPTWEDCPDFDIRRHIFHETVRAPGGEPQLEALSSRILTQIMDRRKPLWDLHVVDGLAEGRGAIIVRIHHALADGVAGMSLMKIMLDADARGTKTKRKPAFRPQPPQQNHSLADALSNIVQGSLESMIAAEGVILDFAHSMFDPRGQDALQKLLGLLPELAASSERFSFNKPCSGERIFCWTDFPLGDVQKVREIAGGTINDAVLTAVTQAIARYVQRHGEAVDGRFLRVVCPVSVRHQEQGESLGNQISFLPVALPLDIRDPVRMLRAVAERMEVMKNARAAHLVALISAWIGAAPPPLQAMFWGALPQIALPLPLFNLICTNVPGPPVPLYALGRKMIASYPHVPTGYELGVNVAVQSYDGHLFCGLTADAHVVPDAGKLRDLIQAAFKDLRRAAGVKTRRPAPRRPRTAEKTAVPPADPVNGNSAKPVAAQMPADRKPKKIPILAEVS